MRFIASIFALTLLAACGTKTPLTLPPQTPQPPAKRVAVPATPATAVDDSNKATPETPR